MVAQRPRSRRPPPPRPANLRKIEDTLTPGPGRAMEPYGIWRRPPAHPLLHTLKQNNKRTGGTPQHGGAICTLLQMYLNVIWGKGAGSLWHKTAGEAIPRNSPRGPDILFILLISYYQKISIIKINNNMSTLQLAQLIFQINYFLRVAPGRLNCSWRIRT